MIGGDSGSHPSDCDNGGPLLCLASQVSVLNSPPHQRGERVVGLQKGGRDGGRSGGVKVFSLPFIW